MNKALGLLLTRSQIGELVKNNELGHRVVAEEFEGPAWTPLPKGGMPSNRVPSFVAGSMGGMAVEVGNAAMLGNWMLQMMWRVSVEKPVTDSLERQTMQVPNNYIGK